MKCANCGNEVSKNYDMCPHCGTPCDHNKENNIQNNWQNSQQNQGQQSYGQNYGQSAPPVYVNDAANAFCMYCGKPIPFGYTVCEDCMRRYAGTDARATRAKSGNKALLIVLIIVLILGIASVGVWAFVLKKDVPTAEKKDDKKQTQTTNKEKDGKSSEEEIENNNNDVSEDDELSNKDRNKEKGKDNDKTKKDSSYSVVYSDSSNGIITWESAKYKADSMGGHLVSINSREEFEKVCNIADNNGLVIFWLGVKRDYGESWSNVYWEDGTRMTYTKWLPGEPSYTEDGVEERYLMALKRNGVWYFNDAMGDISHAYGSNYAYKIAGIVEIED